MPPVRFERPQPNALCRLDLRQGVRFSFGKEHLLCAVDDATRFCAGGKWVPDRREPTVPGALTGILERMGCS